MVRSALKRLACAGGALTVLASSPRLLADDDLMSASISYDARAPIGSFRNFITDVSFQGFQVDASYTISPHFSAGGAIQYNHFQQQFGLQTFVVDNGAITAPTFREASSASIFPTATYYPLGEGIVRPFASLGVGPTSITRAVQASDLTTRQSTLYFFVQPAAGAEFRFGSPPGGAKELASYGATASVAYAFTTASFANVTNLSYFGMQIGLYARY